MQHTCTRTHTRILEKNEEREGGKGRKRENGRRRIGRQDRKEKVGRERNMGLRTRSGQQPPQLLAGRQQNIRAPVDGHFILDAFYTPPLFYNGKMLLFLAFKFFVESYLNSPPFFTGVTLPYFFFVTKVQLWVGLVVLFMCTPRSWVPPSVITVPSILLGPQALPSYFSFISLLVSLSLCTAYVPTCHPSVVSKLPFLHPLLQGCVNYIEKN